jgi:hypothetical protein
MAASGSRCPGSTGIPDMGVQSLRHDYAYHLYRQLRWDHSEEEAISELMQALGLQRPEVILSTYIPLGLRQFVSASLESNSDVTASSDDCHRSVTAMKHEEKQPE